MTDLVMENGSIIEFAETGDKFVGQDVQMILPNPHAIDIDSLDADLIRSRGIYSTIRAKHEDEKKNMSKLCGTAMSLASAILKAVQPNDDDKDLDVTDVDRLLDDMVDTQIYMQKSADRIAALASQRAEWKEKAWPKPPKKGKSDAQEVHDKPV